MNPRGRKGEDGFALVDLLVALAVAGLAGSTLVGLAAFVERQRGETILRRQEHDGLLAAERLLRVLVAEAPPFLPEGGLPSSVYGHARELIVTSTGPAILGLHRASAFKLRAEPRGPLVALVLAWSEGNGKERSQVIADGLWDVAFAYLPPRPDPSRAGWRPDWRAADGALSALRLSLRSGSSTRVVVVPVEARIPATCLRDPRRSGCAVKGLGG